MKKTLLASVLLLAGCGSDQAAIPNQQSIARIGVIAPVNAGLTTFGKGIQNSVELAVEQANAANTVPNWQFAVETEDDSSDPTKGAVAAQVLVNDPSVVGVVGTYNSGVAATALPVLGAAGLAMVSPANTDPTLTDVNGTRPYSDYFRLVVPDTIQGPQLATYAAQTLGLTRVAVITETKSVSQGLADNFASTFTSLGGTVADVEVVPDGTTDFSAALANINPTNPQLIFYGGEYVGAAALRQQITVPLMGGDGIESSSYVSAAGNVSEGDYASSVGAPLASLPGGPSFQTAYNAAGFTDPPTDFGPYAYDAANLIIQSVKAQLTGTSIPSGARAAVVANLQATSTTGVTGPIGFDAFGDTTHKVLTIYRVVNGVFTPQTTITVP